MSIKLWKSQYQYSLDEPLEVFQKKWFSAKKTFKIPMSKMIFCLPNKLAQLEKNSRTYAIGTNQLFTKIASSHCLWITLIIALMSRQHHTITFQNYYKTSWGILKLCSSFCGSRSIDTIPSLWCNSWLFTDCWTADLKNWILFL